MYTSWRQILVWSESWLQAVVAQLLYRRDRADGLGVAALASLAEEALAAPAVRGRDSEGLDAVVTHLVRRGGGGPVNFVSRHLYG
jgi:hypothetical protein